MSERCPECGSDHITGRGFDTGDGDEWQERYCFDCNHGEERLRSQGGVGWYPSRKRKPRKRGPQMEQKLLAEVHAALDDDAPRSIYADWLIEHDHPRGTFIALQLARHAKRDPVVGAEEQELLDEYWRTWLGPAAALVRAAASVELERGFWSVCDGLGRYTPYQAGALENPAWSTVRRMNASGLATREHDLGVFVGPLRRAVRSIVLADLADLARLAEIEPLPQVDELVLTGETGDPARLPPLRVLPALRRLRLGATTYTVDEADGRRVFAPAPEAPPPVSYGARPR